MKSMQLTLLLKVQTLLVRIHPKPHLVKKKLPERSNLKLPRLPNALSKVVLWLKISSQVWMNIYTTYRACTVWNTHFLREIEFGDCRISKTVLLTILRALKFDFNELVQILRAITYRKLKFRASKYAKQIHFLLFQCLKMNNWFHVKSEKQKYPEISTLWNSEQALSTFHSKWWLFTWVIIMIHRT